MIGDEIINKSYKYLYLILINNSLFIFFFFRAIVVFFN